MLSFMPVALRECVLYVLLTYLMVLKRQGKVHLYILSLCCACLQLSLTQLQIYTMLLKQTSEMMKSNE